MCGGGKRAWVPAGTACSSERIVFMITYVECPDCQASNATNARYCGSCGLPFKGDPTNQLNRGQTAPAIAVPTPSPPAGDYGSAGNLLSPDALLQGRYRITQLLGQGGMGAVYLASDTRFSSKTCVVKEMLDHFSDPEQRAQATESFHREADMLAQLKHAGIPEVYDRFTEANRHYLVMEYINGTDLEQRLIDKGGFFHEKEVIAWMIQCCDVLSYLHHQRPPIIYRDMKPANIITTNWGKVYLVDFGIARFFNPVSRGTMIGTQGYAPPEQYRGQVEPRSDLYALGATMHYLLTGRDPQNEPPFSFPPLSSLNPDVSEEVELLVLKALDPDVENRFVSADEMLGELMVLAGDSNQVIRECPHCGKKSTVTRQFCPHCKKYISKKAHVLNPRTNGSGPITDAAGMHINRLVDTSSLNPLPGKQPTSVTLALPTGKTELPVIALRPILLSIGVAALATLGLFGLWYMWPANGKEIISEGDAILTTAGTAKVFAATRYRRAQTPKEFLFAAAKYHQAYDDNPSDVESLIYWQNATVHATRAPHVKIAVAGPLTGGFQAKGLTELQGAAMAQARFNAANPNKQVLLTLANDRSSHEGAVEVAAKVINDERIVGVVGHLDSFATRAAMPFYNLRALPVISPTSTSTELTDTSPCLFRLSPGDAQQGAILANQMVQVRKLKRIAVVFPKSNQYIQGLATSFTRRASALGAQIFPMMVMPDTAWIEVGRALQGQGVQGVFLAGSHLDALKLAEAQQKLETSLPIFGGDSLYMPELVEKGGRNVEGLVCTSYYHEGVGAEEPLSFTNRFYEKFGHSANSRAALTYEALSLLMQAIDRPTSHPDEIVRRLKRLGSSGYDSVTGRAVIDTAGVARRPMYVMQVQRGRFVAINTVSLQEVTK